MTLIEEIKKIIKSEKLDIDLNLTDEKLIIEFKDKVNWYEISYHKKLSENFIIEFKDKVDWWEISYHQKLSEKFIREFKDKVDWYEISYHQKLSESFIIEFKDKVYWYGIRHNENIKISNRFLVEIYKLGNEKAFYELKQKTELKEYAIKIEEEVLVLFLEIV